jgi:hypothetical protein
MIDGLRSRGETTHPLVELGGRFRFNTTLFNLLVDGWKSGEWHRREGDASSAHWVLGHLVVMRFQLLRTLGVKTPERDWEELFTESQIPSSLGFTGPLDRFETIYPAHDELVGSFRSTDRPLVRALCEISESEARAGYGGVAEAEPGTPVTLGGCAGFFYFDEAFHLGQLGLLRQQLGMPRVP